jgi:hypothetical protein
MKINAETLAKLGLQGPDLDPITGYTTRTGRWQPTAPGPGKVLRHKDARERVQGRAGARSIEVRERSVTADPATGERRATVTTSEIPGPWYPSGDGYRFEPATGRTAHLYPFGIPKAEPPPAGWNERRIDAARAQADRARAGTVAVEAAHVARMAPRLPARDRAIEHARKAAEAAEAAAQAARKEAAALHAEYAALPVGYSADTGARDYSARAVAVSEYWIASDRAQAAHKAAREALQARDRAQERAAVARATLITPTVVRRALPGPATAPLAARLPRLSKVA